MKEGDIYTARYGSDGRHYVNGPGNGMAYDHGTLWPYLRAETEKQAEWGSKIANIAYLEGYKQAKRDIRKALEI
jgi:hypothetical protein